MSLRSLREPFLFHAKTAEIKPHRVRSESFIQTYNFSLIGHPELVSGSRIKMMKQVQHKHIVIETYNFYLKPARE
jgi:hypothetical protein